LIPPEIEVVGRGMVFTIPIWVEAPVTFRIEKEKTEVGAFETVGNQKQRPILMKDSTFGETSHVGATGSKENSNKRAHGGLMKGKGPLWAKLKPK